MRAGRARLRGGGVSVRADVRDCSDGRSVRRAQWAPATAVMDARSLSAARSVRRLLALNDGLQRTQRRLLLFM